MTDSLVSIIIPVYNAAPYLGRCLESVINQTYANLEIILINDGSTDGSGELCETFALRDARVKVFHQANAGSSSARNNGIKNALGKYINFVDSDDFLHPAAIESAVNKMETYKTDLVMWAMNIYMPNGKSIKRPLIWQSGKKENAELQKIIQECLQGAKNSSHNIVICLFKKEIIDFYDIIAPEDLVQGEDFYMLAKYLIHSKSAYIIQDGYYYNYYYNTESISKKPSDLFVKQCLIMVTRIMQMLGESKNNEIYLKSYSTYIIHTISYLTFMLAKNKTETLKNKALCLSEFVKNTEVQYCLKNANYKAMAFHKSFITHAVSKQYYKTAILLMQLIHAAYNVKTRLLRGRN